MKNCPEGQTPETWVKVEDHCPHTETENVGQGILVCKKCDLMFADAHSWRMEKTAAAEAIAHYLED